VGGEDTKVDESIQFFMEGGTLTLNNMAKLIKVIVHK